jgi:PAS domain S-box-containing protein
MSKAIARTGLTGRQIADVLIQKKESILSAWEEKVRALLPAAHDKSHSALRNSLPASIDRLSEALVANFPKSGKTEAVGKSHADQRVELPNYTLGQVIDEYKVLRQTLFEKLGSENLTDHQRNIILDFLQDEMKEAAEEYARIHLADSETQFRTLADSIPQLAWMADPNGSRFWYNERWHSYAGTTLKEMEGWGWRKIHHPEHVEKVTLKYKRHIDCGEPWEDTFPLRSKSGEWRWFLSQARPIRDKSGNILRWFGTNTDVTDQRETQEKLNEVSVRLHLALNASGVGFFDHDLKTDIVKWTKEEAEIYGFPPDLLELQYSEVASRIHPEDREGVRTNREDVANNHGEYESSFRVLWRDGTIRWVTGTGKVICDESGKPVRMLGANLDFTDRKHAEEALAESMNRFRELAESMPQIVLETDSKGDPYYYNKQWYEYLGISPSEKTSQSWWTYVHSDCRNTAENDWQKSILQKIPFQMELRLRRSDGTYSWFLTRVVPILNSFGRIVRWYGTFTNIDENRKIGEQLLRAVQSREETLAVVSHDLRNPLGSILMNSALLKMKSSGDETFVKGQADKIQKAGDRMNEMIEDLLNIAKMDSGNFTLSKKDNCGCNLVNEAVETMSHLAGEKNIRIETSGVETSIQVNCDYGQVLRIFTNLIGNAVKFTPDHGLIRVTAEDLGSEVQFSVADSGPGILEAHIPHIFDRFWQVSKTQHLGTGLGLAIAKGIVQGHRGRIWVKSKFGHGSAFYFTLPKARVDK